MTQPGPMIELQCARCGAELWAFTVLQPPASKDETKADVYLEDLFARTVARPWMNAHYGPIDIVAIRWTV